VRTADLQVWIGLSLLVMWLAVVVVALTGRGIGIQRASWPTLVASGAAAALFAVYGGIVDAVADPAPLAAADGPTLRWMVGHRTGVLTPVMAQVSNAGGTPGMTVLTAIGVALLTWKRRFRDAIVVLVAGAVAGPLVSAYKHLYARPRPPAATQLVAEPSYALPSGHSLSSMVVVGILAVVVTRMLHSALRRILTVSAAALVIATIGVSRLYLGVHWLTDVLAGWSLGGAWLSLCTVALVYRRPRQTGIEDLRRLPAHSSLVDSSPAARPHRAPGRTPEATTVAISSGPPRAHPAVPTTPIS